MANKLLRSIKFPDIPNNYYVPDYYESAYIENKASGSIASFSDGANDVPMKELIANIEPAQEGTGDPSPDNIRPINGWTGANVAKAGKNLLPNIVSKITDTVVMLGQTASYATDRKIFIPAGTYTISAQLLNSYFLYYRNEDSSISDRSSIAKMDHSLTFVNPKDDYFAFWVYDANSQVDVSDVVNFQLELGSTATDYEPYQGETYGITFPSEAGTVYGGKLNVTTGELVVDRAIVDMGNLNWTLSTGLSGRYYAALPSTSITPIPPYGDVSALCEVYPRWDVTAISSQPDISFYVNCSKFSSSKRVVVRDTTAADAVTLKSNLVGKMLIYSLAMPITYQLTSVEIDTLLGGNNIFADTGDIEVTYRADPKKYINRLTAPDDDMVADTNIPSGKYFIVNNILYLSTTAITSGEAIIPGTNCIATDLAEALNTLNA